MSFRSSHGLDSGNIVMKKQTSCPQPSPASPSADLSDSDGGKDMAMHVKRGNLTWSGIGGRATLGNTSKGQREVRMRER